VGFVLFVVLALALAAVLNGARATRDQARAEQAEAKGLERIWKAYAAQGHALRITAEAGRKDASLAAISNAAAIHPSAALRSGAVASLALWDLVRAPELVAMPKEAEQA